CQQNSNRPYTF
nr:immunoglobulin light chain junction region [Macaca mulatta]MOV79175.1 immunoglobulin light chain junction region [Macaca mulatta]MOV80125.1 immunoglobulin light chain junction region [Macaca mulatta]MOV80499.1 immunoglobulin light chain junction region [Macaca mulatta]MOV80905.1 immunoglobulin light chain junction region [Macaca mulatta]